MTSKPALSAGASPRALFQSSVTAPIMLRGAQVAYSPDDGTAPLSVDQAVAALRQAEPDLQPEAQAAEPEHPDAPEPEPEAALEPDPESEAEPAAEDLLDPETAIEETEDPEPESDPAKPIIAAPKSWDAQERDTFAKLPPAAQEIILKRETERDRAVSKAQQESSAAQKSAEAGLKGLAQYKDVFDQIATRANQVFADRWANTNWVALAQQVDPQTYNALKAEYEAHTQELQRVQQAREQAVRVQQEAEKTQIQSYVREEFTKLAEIAPELADAQTGPAKRTEVAQFLLGQGFEREAIDRISAAEMVIAYEAMQFRQLKAKGKTVAAKPAAPPAPRPNPAPARASAPSAAPATRPTAQRNVEAARNRFAQTGSTDDAVALLRASRGAT